MKHQVVVLTLALLAFGQASTGQNLLNKLPHNVKKELKDLKYVQGGPYSLGVNAIGTYTNTTPVTIQSYYLSAYEVTNGDWHTFYKAMVDKLGAEQAKRFMPDTAAWTKSFPYTYNQPLVDYYYSHPGYTKYPVVGITWNQAVAYCEWQSEKINKQLKDEGVDGYTVKIRLPLKNEWEYATATPLFSYNNNAQENTIALRTPVKKMKKRHLWNLSPYNGLINKLGYQANFGPMVDSSGFMFKSYIDDGGFYTVPARCYFPNDLGMCNLRGNVEEWVADAPENGVITKGYEKYLQTNTAETNTEMHICKGGSWVDTAYYLATWAEKAYPANTATPFTGFRVAMDVVEVKPTAGK